MRAIVVGIANQRTTLPVGHFPVQSSTQPRLGGQIRHAVGGVAFTIARSLAALGDEVALAAPLGEDYPAALVDTEAYRYAMSTHLCKRILDRTPRSVVLYDDDGRRQVFNDLTDAAGVSFSIADLVPDALNADLITIAARSMCTGLAADLAARSIPFAVDLQAIEPDAPAHLIDPFLPARLITMSGELVPGNEERTLLALARRSGAEVCCLTMAERGTLVVHRRPGGTWPDRPTFVPTHPVRITSTLGAGDTFLAVLAHGLYAQHLDPVTAVGRAQEAVGRLLADEPAHGGIALSRLSVLLGGEVAPFASA